MNAWTLLWLKYRSNLAVHFNVSNTFQSQKSSKCFWGFFESLHPEEIVFHPVIDLKLNPLHGFSSVDVPWARLLTIVGIYFFYRLLLSCIMEIFPKATYKLKPSAVSPEPMFSCLKLFILRSIVCRRLHLWLAFCYLVILFRRMFYVFTLSFSSKSAAFYFLFFQFCLKIHLSVNLPSILPLSASNVMKQSVIKQLW